MDAASVTRIEKGVDRSASALLGLACGYAAYAWFGGRTHGPVLGLEVAAACALGYLLSLKGLSSIRPEPRKLPVPIFDVREVEPMPSIELLQRVRSAAERPAPEVEPATEVPVIEEVSETPAVREAEAPVEAAQQAEPEAQPDVVDSAEMNLGDPAPQADIESLETPFVPEADRDEDHGRVVHLFDPAAMPTPEEMISRIDRHLEGHTSAAQSADAAQALHEALAELRRSIR
jgi:hypothetical protein